MRNSRLFALLATILLGLTACAPSGPTTVATEIETDVVVETDGGTPAAHAGPLKVLASFYPLQFVAERVGGDLVNVTNLTPPAAEPHDLELSLAQARNIGNADVVVLLGGFQPAVDEAVAQQHPARVVDAAEYVDLVSADETGALAEEEEEGEHADEHADDEHGHDHEALGNVDPHFWLDPTKLAQLAQPVADAFAAADPAHAEQFHANATALEGELADLDAEFTEQLAPVKGATLVTNHTAFGYLARRYGLQQVGITGIDPDTEPSPARMREIADIARANGVKTLFYESLVSPRVVETLANDLGINAASLDPIEGLNDEAMAAGGDYLTLMRQNLETLVNGLTRQ